MTVHEPLTEDEKTTWIEALRSGDYEQGQGCLRIEGAHCCLGVLGELVGFDDLKGVYLSKYYSEDEPPIFLKLPRVIQHALAGYNDNGYSFEDIADYLESVPVEELLSATECLPPQAGASL